MAFLSAEEKRALTQRRVEAPRRKGRGEDIAALHALAGQEVYAQGLKAQRAQEPRGAARTRAEVY